MTGTLPLPLGTSPWGEAALVLCDRVLELGGDQALVRPIQEHARSGAMSIASAQVSVHSSLLTIATGPLRFDPTIDALLSDVVVRSQILRSALVTRDRIAPDPCTRDGRRWRQSLNVPLTDLEHAAGVLARRALGWWGSSPVLDDGAASRVAGMILARKHTRPPGEWGPKFRRAWTDAVGLLRDECRALGFEAAPRAARTPGSCSQTLPSAHNVTAVGSPPPQAGHLSHHLAVAVVVMATTITCAGVAGGVAARVSVDYRQGSCP